MSIRDDLTIDWFADPRIIEIAAPSVDLDIQDLIDTLRFLEYQPTALSFGKIVDSAGKQSLGGSAYVGITLTLLNAKVKFEERGGPTWVQCMIGGGNLVALDGNGDPMSPIEPSAYTQVSLAQSSSPTIIETGVSGLTSEESDALAGIRNAVATRKDIDYTGDDALGWQEILYDENETEVGRMNLFDETGTRISGTVSDFIDSKHMIARRIPA